MHTDVHNVQGVEDARSRSCLSWPWRENSWDSHGLSRGGLPGLYASSSAPSCCCYVHESRTKKGHKLKFSGLSDNAKAALPSSRASLCYYGDGLITSVPEHFLNLLLL